MHLGMDRLVTKMKQQFWFPKMISKTEKYINNCDVCQLEKHMRNPCKAPLKTRKVVTKVGEVWYLDHFGPINMKKQKHYIIHHSPLNQ